MASHLFATKPEAPLSQRATFAAATVTVGYLAWKCMVPPRPLRVDISKDPYNPTFKRISFSMLALYRSAILVSSILNAIASLSDASHTQNRHLNLKGLAPYANHINASTICWTLLSATTLALIATTAALRLYTISALGKSFTFDLHEPEKLKTDGIYAHLQHPSYTMAMGAFSGAAVWFLRIDGAAGAFVPPVIYDFAVRWQSVFHMLVVVLLPIALRMRVHNEEAMLKKAFGKEWVRWNRRTARFVPFLF